MLEKLQDITGESDEELLSSLLYRAETILLIETNRSELTPILERAKLEYALHLYNIRDITNESSRSEGGISVTYNTEVPEHIKNIILNQRLARVIGYDKEE